MSTLWSVGSERLQKFANNSEHIPVVVRGKLLTETKWRPSEKVSGMGAAKMLLLFLAMSYHAESVYTRFAKQYCL